MENETLAIQLYLFSHLSSEGVLTCHYLLHNKKLYLLISLFFVALSRGGVVRERWGGDARLYNPSSWLSNDMGLSCFNLKWDTNSTEDDLDCSSIK